jgi:hypothetical protein
MRDLLSKLDKILLESAENTDANIQGKRKALQDIEKIPAAKDPEIKRAIDAKKAELGQSALKANKGVAESSLEELASGGEGGNGPFDYGSAIVQIGQDYAESFNDDGDGADAARIVRVGKTFMSKGMSSGIEAFYAMDTFVRDHVAEELMDQGFNVKQDIYAPYKQQMAKAKADTDKYRSSLEYAASRADDLKISAIPEKPINSWSKPGEPAASVSMDNASKRDVKAEFEKFKQDVAQRNSLKGVPLKFVVTVGGKPVDIDKLSEQGVAEGFQIGDEFGISFSEDFEIGSTIVGIVEDGIVIELDDRAFEFLTNEGWTFEDGELTEGVAGPKSCWKGYRKVGTKPGTGKNAGKRVNDCEKISESTGIKWDWKGNDPEQIEIKIDGMPYLLKNTENGVVIHGADIPGTWGSGEDEGSLDFEANLKGDIHWATFDSGSNYGPGEPDDYVVADHLGYVLDEIKKQYGETWEQIKDEAEGGLSIEKESITQEAEYQGRKVALGKPMAGDVKKSKVYVKNPQGNVVKVNFGDKKMRIKKSNPGRRKSFRARHNCSNPGPRHKARYWSCRAW